MFLYELVLLQTDMYKGTWQLCLVSWQPQRNFVKVVMSMLILTNRQTDRNLAVGHNYETINY